MPYEFHPIDGADHGFDYINLHVDKVEPGLIVFDRMVEWIHAALFKPGCLYAGQGQEGKIHREVPGDDEAHHAQRLRNNAVFSTG